MDTDNALSILSALAHPTRLEAFRLLVRHEPDGLSTGDLVEASGLSQSTFSTHLAVLVKAGLVLAEKRGGRKGVVWGKSVSVRVDLGGRRIIKKKKIADKGNEK